MESGPFRIMPGKLSVSRSFGDVEAKLEALGGNNKVLLATPEIKSFKITTNADFIFLGCDGIFDSLSNIDVIQSIWSMTSDNALGTDIHEQAGKCADIIIRNCIALGAIDNITCILICFENFKKNLFETKHENTIRAKHFENIKNSLKFITDYHIKDKEDELDNSMYIRFNHFHSNSNSNSNLHISYNSSSNFNSPQHSNTKFDKNYALQNYISNSLSTKNNLNSTSTQRIQKKLSINKFSRLNNKTNKHAISHDQSDNPENYLPYLSFICNNTSKNGLLKKN